MVPRGSLAARLKRAIVGLALPNIPQAIFFALQAQISLFLITFFGHTQGVSSVGALARLGQIFVIFKQANMLFVEPHFAKLPKAKLAIQVSLPPFWSQRRFAWP